MPNAATVSRIDQDQTHAAAADSFAHELSALCRKYGLGIAGEPTLFVMDREDYAFDYSVDNRSRLIWGCAK
jgi:hypothetical protein